MSARAGAITDCDGRLTSSRVGLGAFHEGGGTGAVRSIRRDNLSARAHVVSSSRADKSEKRKHCLVFWRC